ncbi:MAG: Ig-like domain-containing protein [Alphaproteobacteria bacterium]|nr:Ig-like domain-containing protein [Alphaproteobacteria bacterium]
MLANDTDPDGGVVTLTGVAGSAANLGVAQAGTYGSLTLNADGTYAYTLANASPAVQTLRVGQIVTDTFAYAVADGQGGSAMANIVVSIAGRNDAPTVTSAVTASVLEDATLSAAGSVFTTARDIDVGDTLSVDRVNGQATSVGVSIAGTYGSIVIGQDGQYVYTLNNAAVNVQALNAGQTVTDSFTYRLVDGSGGVVNNTLVVSVAGRDENRPPVAANDAVAGSEDVAATFDPRANDSDPDSNSLTVTQIASQAITAGQTVQLPGGHAATLNANGTITLVPAANYNGPVLFVYTISDGQGATASATATVTFSPVNDAPTIQILAGDTASTTILDTAGSAATFTSFLGSVYVSDVDLGDVSFSGSATLNSSTNGAALGIFGGAGGGPGVSAAIWVYNIPGSVLDSLGAGQTVVETGTLFVFDGNGGTATLPISVTLVGANDVPTIANALTAQSAAEDAVFSFQVPAGVFADADNGDVLSYTATLSNGSVLPTWLSFNPATRTFLGTPAQADVANLTIRVTASDGNGGVVFDEFALNVAGTNDAPNAVNDVASTSEDISVTINVLANDTDPDAGEVLSVSEIGGQAVTSGQAVTLAGGAQATLNAGGTITYAPAANVSGPATFTYTVSDGQGGSASASVTVDVAPAAAAAIIGFGGGPLSPIQAFDVPIPSSATGPEGAAGIANTADGFAVIWYSLQGSVNIQRYSAQGENIGSTAIVNPSTAGQARYAGIAGLADGGTIVVWAAGDIRAQRFDASGSPVGASEFLVNTVSGNLRGSTVTALNDGGFAITWIAEGQGGPGFGIYTQRFTAGGAKAGNETRVNTSAATEVAVRSAALEGGGYVVSWSSPGADGHDMYTQRFNAAGVPVGAELRVNTTTPNNQYWAAVAGLNGGGFVIGWSSDGQDGSGFGSYAQRFDANGTPVGGEIPLNTYTAGNQTQPMIAALADGGFVASWTSNGQDGSGRGIFAQRFDAAGVRVGGEERLNATTANDQYNDTNGGGAHLIAMPGGLLAQVFVGDGAAGNIYFRQFDTRLGFEGSEDGAIPLPITVAAEPGDSIAQVVLSGLPAGSVLSAGTSNGDGTAWTFAGAPPANLTLTPPTNFNGAFSLTVTATTQDGADTQTSSASRSVTVSAVNDLPVAVNNSATTAEDTPVTIDVLSNDSDPDAGNVLSVGQIDGQNVIAGQTLTLAGGAQATLNANGTITYAPATNANGAASFAYTVSDGQGGTASATANITVTPVAADASIVFSSGPGLGPIDAGLVRVNATASVGIYNESSVAALSGGGFVVTWTRGAPDGTVGVRSQRFDAAGSPVGVETLVNSSPDGLQLQPTVTSLPDGGHVIAWLSYNQIGQAGEVYARRYDASGVAIGPEFRVNATTAGEQGFPDVVALAGGGFVIGFSGTDAADNGVWVRIFDAAGGSIGGDIKLNQGAPGAQNSPRIAALADGGFVAAWFAPDADTTGIYARRFDASGAPAGNEFPVSSYVAGEQLDAHIATLSGGGFVIVWGSLAQDGSGYGIYAQRYDASGIADGSEFRLNQTTGGNQFEPSIAEMPDGGFVASWRSAAQGQVLRRFGADGLPIGDEFVVSGVIHNNESEGGLAVLADGVVIQTVAGGGLVYIRRYAAADTFAGAEDGSISLPITVAAEPGDSVAQIVLSGLPVGSVLSAGMSNGDGSVWTFAGSPPATLTLTPPANYNGAFTLTVTATTQDGASTATSVATRTVAITAVNDAPVAANDTASVNEDGSVVISLLTNDADVDGDTLAVTQIDGQAAAVGVAVNLASGGTATRSADNTITYAPAANANGQKAFSYTISDGNGGSDTASVTVDVARAADPAGISFGGIAPIDLNDARVNTTTANTQSFSAVSPLPGGGHVVVWRSVSAAGGTPPNELCDIYMQLYDAAGAPAGGEVRVNATFPGLTLQTFPGVATLADGSFVITWSLYTGPTNTFEIWARRFNADGTPLLNAGSPTTGEFIVTNPNSPPFQFLSTIAALPDGSFVIAWESGSSASGFDIRFQRFDASNAPAGGPVTVNQLASGNAFNEYADIAVLGDGSFVIAWETSPIYASANSTANTDVVGRRFSSAGAPMGDEFVISTTTTESQTKPDVAALAGGGFVVTWTSYRQAGADQGADVYMQRYDSAGVRVGGETLINLDTAGGQGFSTVQSLADGGFVVTWASGASLLNDGVSDGTANLVAQRFDAAGVRIGGEVRINAATAGQQWTESWASDSAFTVTPEGVLVHTFYGDGEVYVRRFDTNVFGGAEDGLIRLPVTVAADPGDSIAQVVLSGLPAGSVLSAGSSSNGGTTWTFASAPPANLTLTAPANYNGAFTLTVTATTQDGTDTDTTTATQTVTVTAVNDAPTASNDAASIGEDSTAALTGNVLTNDGDVDLDTLTVSAGTGARTSAYGTLTLNANGSYSYALNTAAVQALGASDTATDSFTYQVSDGQGGAAQAALTITIQGADDPAFSIQRISTDAAGAQGNSSSEQPAISADGRYVTFLSYASNLVAGDTNNTGDIFRKDLQTGAITRVSTDTAGVQANNFSEQPAISADGRYVTFQSYASNLVPGDTNGQPDIFRKDLQTGAITRVSTDAAGAQANTSSEQHAISADGRYVTFLSFASNLVAGDTDNTIDIFRKDLQTGAITRVSTDAAGAQGNNASFEPAISADGRYVTFYSSASNLVAGDTNGQPDIFRKDLQTGAITRVSTDASGAQGNTSSFDPGISSDGRYVTFSSNASNLVAGDTNNTTDIYRKDLQTGAIVRVSSDASGAQGNNTSSGSAISSDGRYVTFYSSASNLVAGDTNNLADIFRKDLQTGAITRVSTDAAGVQGNNISLQPAISADGRYVTFRSDASNLVAGDTNAPDIFVVDLPPPQGDLPDIATGASSADRIVAYAGPQILTGGAGADSFIFATPAAGGDTITDFAPGSDRIEVSASGFGGGLAAGPLPGSSLVSGAAPAATLASGQFLYNTGSGQLSWDADGTGGGAAVLLAALSGAPAITSADIGVVASLPPLILDLDGNGVELVSGVSFDFDGDGNEDTGGWASAGDAFLALDRNGDGLISTGSEISFAGDLPGATSDLDGLRAFDSNGDGALSAADAQFAKFLVWRDADGDGVSDAGELRSLAEAGVVSIGLDRYGEASTGPAGDILGYATVTMADGASLRAADVVLNYTNGESDLRPTPHGSAELMEEHAGSPAAFFVADDHFLFGPLEGAGAIEAPLSLDQRTMPIDAELIEDAAFDFSAASLLVARDMATPLTLPGAGHDDWLGVGPAFDPVDPGSLDYRPPEPFHDRVQGLDGSSAIGPDAFRAL